MNVSVGRTRAQQTIGMDVIEKEFREGSWYEILEREEQLVASRNCLILTDYTKRACIGTKRLKKKNGNLCMHSKWTFMRTYNLFRLCSWCREKRSR